MKTIAAFLLMVALYAHAEEPMVHLVNTRQCSEIGNSDVRAQCVEAFKTQNSFDYPKRMQMYVSSDSSATMSAPVAEAPKPEDNRTQMEKEIHVIAIATTVTAAASVISLLFSFILLVSI